MFAPVKWGWCHKFRCLQGPSRKDTGVKRARCRREEGAGEGEHGRQVPCLQGQPLVRANQLLLGRAAIAKSLDYFQKTPDILIVP